MDIQLVLGSESKWVLGNGTWKWNMVRQDPHGNWDLHFCFGLLWLGSRIEQRHRMGVHWILCCIDFFNVGPPFVWGVLIYSDLFRSMRSSLFT